MLIQRQRHKFDSTTPYVSLTMLTWQYCTHHWFHFLSYPVFPSSTIKKFSLPDAIPKALAELEDGDSIECKLTTATQLPSTKICDPLTFWSNTQGSWRTIPVASLLIVFSAVLVLVLGQTHTHTQTDADECFTPMTLIGVSTEAC